MTGPGEDVIPACVRQTATKTSPLSVAVIIPLGGAVARVVGTRIRAALQPFSRGVCINEMGSEGDERIRAAYQMNQNIKPTI